MQALNTRKLYDEDAYIKEFETTVTASEKTEKGTYKTVLESTAFFPEQGGQACDKGTIDGHEVLYVEEKDGIIYHTTKEPVSVGAKIKGVIDFASRYRNMQHHSGEHIVSGLIYKAYGYANVGFHLGSGDMTMDYDGEIDRENLEAIEKAANKVIYENIEIICKYPENEELKNTFYRSKLELEENIRIVTIGEYDTCACCAPHVKMTGEIGIIKFTDYYRYKGGMRIHALCGYDAVCDYISKHNDLKEVSAKLSAKLHEVPLGVDRILEENTKLNMKIAEQSEKIATLIASKVKKTDGAVAIFEAGITQNEMRSVANAVVADCKVCCVFSGNDEIGYSFILASDKHSSRAILDEMKKSFSIKGGGNDKMVQGSTTAKRSELEEFILHI